MPPWNYTNFTYDDHKILPPIFFPVGQRRSSRDFSLVARGYPHVAWAHLLIEAGHWSIQVKA